MFENVLAGISDPILMLNEVYINDTNPQKINLGIGVYKNEDNITPIMPVVKIAEQRLIETQTEKSYLSQVGYEPFNSATQQLIFGANHQVIQQQRAITIQTISGTNAIRLVGDFIKQALPKDTTVWLSNPPYPNYTAIFKHLGLNLKSYRYLNPANNSLDWDGMYADLSTAKTGDIILFNASSHNPTGVDLTEEQWRQVAALAEKNHWLPIFDIAYQGFASGIDEDAYAIRYFADKVPEMFVLNSYSKNMGLYCERIGSITIIAATNAIAKNLASKFKTIIRSIYSTPAAHGGMVVATVLHDEQLKQQWFDEVKIIRDRLNNSRPALVKKLEENNCPRDFSHICQHKGMFSYSGLNKEHAELLRTKYSIYILDSGRINVAGISDKNIDYIAKAITDVVNTIA